MSGFRTNLLKQPHRTYPVDFSSPYEENLNTTIMYDPILFDVESLPGQQAYAVAGGIATFRLFVEKDEGTIRLASQFELKKQRIEAQHYTALRQLFENIEQSLTSVVVLQRREP